MLKKEATWLSEPSTADISGARMLTAFAVLLLNWSFCSLGRATIASSISFVDETELIILVTFWPLPVGSWLESKVMGKNSASASSSAFLRDVAGLSPSLQNASLRASRKLFLISPNPSPRLCSPVMALATKPPAVSIRLHKAPSRVFNNLETSFTIMSVASFIIASRKISLSWTLTRCLQSILGMTSFGRVKENVGSQMSTERDFKKSPGGG